MPILKRKLNNINIIAQKGDKANGNIVRLNGNI